MELREGYINTELGQVPADWKATTFGDTFTGFSSGMTPYRGKPEYYTGKIPWITSGELNYNTITDTWEKITEEAVLETNLKILPVGTFLMAITGLEAAGTRGSCAITGLKATTNQSCMALFPIKDRVTTEYLYHFYVYYGDTLAFKYCQGTKQQSYTSRIAKRLPINLPPTLTEQKAIAQVLSDTDALIQALEKKIAKKKLIKKGVMQKLFTPKEGWIEVELGSIGNFKNGINKSKEDFGFGFPFVNLMDVFGKPMIKGTEVFDLINSNDVERNLYNLKKGDVLFIRSSVKPSGVGLTSVVLNDLQNMVFSGFLIRFRENIGLDIEFKKHCFFNEKFRNELIANSSVSANTNINQDALRKLKLNVPPIAEQTRIAEILSDMDNEIEQLQQKQSKYKLAKQGMTQQLLTGKIRLVKPNSNAEEENLAMAAEPNESYQRKN